MPKGAFLMQRKDQQVIDKIKIGWKEYDVIIAEPTNTLYGDGIERYGEINYLTQKIYLRKSNTDDQMMSTLIH